MRKILLFTIILHLLVFTKSQSFFNSENINQSSDNVINDGKNDFFDLITRRNDNKYLIKKRLLTDDKKKNDENIFSTDDLILMKHFTIDNNGNTRSIVGKKGKVDNSRNSSNEIYLFVIIASEFEKKIDTIIKSTILDKRCVKKHDKRLITDELFKKNESHHYHRINKNNNKKMDMKTFLSQHNNVKLHEANGNERKKRTRRSLSRQDFKLSDFFKLDNINRNKSYSNKVKDTNVNETLLDGIKGLFRNDKNDGKTFEIDSKKSTKTEIPKELLHRSRKILNVEPEKRENFNTTTTTTRTQDSNPFYNKSFIRVQFRTNFEPHHKIVKKDLRDDKKKIKVNCLFRLKYKLNGKYPIINTNKNLKNSLTNRFENEESLNLLDEATFEELKNDDEKFLKKLIKQSKNFKQEDKKRKHLNRKELWKDETDKIYRKMKEDHKNFVMEKMFGKRIGENRHEILENICEDCSNNIQISDQCLGKGFFLILACWLLSIGCFFYIIYLKKNNSVMILSKKSKEGKAVIVQNI